MGMFDDVRCNYPLPDGLVLSGFQTKDFHCELDLYTITKEGRLMYQGSVFGGGREKEPLKDTQYHGLMRFYTSDNGHVWHAYQAKFTDGQLVEILKLDEH